MTHDQLLSHMGQKLVAALTARSHVNSSKSGGLRLENRRCGRLPFSDLQLHAFTRGENDEFAVETVDPVAAAFNDLIDEAVRVSGVMVEYGKVLCSSLDSQIHCRQATGMAPALFRRVLRVGVLAIGDEQISV